MVQEAPASTSRALEALNRTADVGKTLHNTGMRWFQVVSRKAICYNRRGVVWCMVIALLAVAIIGILFVLLGSVLLASGVEWKDSVEALCCETGTRVANACWNGRCQEGGTEPSPACYGNVYQIGLTVLANSTSCPMETLTLADGSPKVYTLETGCISKPYEEIPCNEQLCYLKSCNSTEIKLDDPDYHMATGIWMVVVGGLLLIYYVLFCIFGLLLRLRDEAIRMTKDREYTGIDQEDIEDVKVHEPIDESEPKE